MAQIFNAENAEKPKRNFHRVILNAENAESAERSYEIQPKRLTFEELSGRLHEYERNYGYSTIEFYRRFQNGELGDDEDMMIWNGRYHLYLTSLPIRQFMQNEIAGA